MPRRILIACWGSYGDVYPYVGLAKALKDRGHQSIVAAPAYYRPVVEQEAIDFAPVGPDIDPNDREMTARVMHPVKGTEAVVDLVVAALQQTYEEMRRAADGVDLIVSHPLTFTAPMLAQQRGLPWVSTLLAPLGFFSVTDFPVLPPAPWVVHLRGLGPWFGQDLWSPCAPCDAGIDGTGLSAARRSRLAARRTSALDGRSLPR
jgi:UDP:flavonoid glycosyltransferase YjiC (YdhE family)